MTVQGAERKLAAIMFTDMVGYSALAQRNEALALDLLAEHQDRLRPIFSQHGGACARCNASSPRWVLWGTQSGWRRSWHDLPAVGHPLLLSESFPRSSRGDSVRVVIT